MYLCKFSLKKNVLICRQVITVHRAIYKVLQLHSLVRVFTTVCFSFIQVWQQNKVPCIYQKNMLQFRQTFRFMELECIKVWDKMMTVKNSLYLLGEVYSFGLITNMPDQLSNLKVRLGTRVGDNLFFSLLLIQNDMFLWLVLKHWSNKAFFQIH